MTSALCCAARLPDCKWRLFCVECCNSQQCRARAFVMRKFCILMFHILQQKFECSTRSWQRRRKFGLQCPDLSLGAARLADRSLCGLVDLPDDLVVCQTAVRRIFAHGVVLRLETRQDYDVLSDSVSSHFDCFLILDAGPMCLGHNFGASSDVQSMLQIRSEA